MVQSAMIRMVYTGLLFLAGLVISNLALPEGFGIISLLILNASLLSLVTGLGADSLILHMMANDKWTRQQAAYFLWGTLGLQLLLFLLLQAAFLLLGQRTMLSGQQGWTYFFFDLLYFAGLILTEKLTAFLYALQKARAVNLLLCFFAFLYLLVLWAGYAGLHAHFTTILFVFVLQSLLQGLVLLLYVVRQVGLQVKRVPPQQLWQVLKMSVVVMVTNVIQLLAYRIDFWLLSYYYSGYEVGLYAQANKFANLIWILPNIMAQLLIPRFTMLSQTDLPKLFGLGFFTNFILAVATVVCTQVFYGYFLDAAYLEGLPAFYRMLPGYFFWAGVVYFGAYVSWAGRFKLNLLGSACCLILVLAADLLLIPRLGLNGAAWANSFAYTAVFLLYVFMFARRFGVNWAGAFRLQKKDWQTLVKFVTG